MAKVLGLLIPLFYLIVIYVYPRIIVGSLGVANPWTSYLYQYGFGFLFFMTGMVLIKKSGACDFNRGHDKFWYKILYVGFAAYAGFHAIWIYMSLNMPVFGSEV